MSNVDIDKMVSDYRLMLCRLAYVYLKNRADAEDAVQEVFLYAFRKQPQFNAEEHKRAWLIQAVIHRSINILKKASKREIPVESILEQNTIHSNGSREEIVLEALMMLPSKYKVILHLYYYEENSIEDIGIMLDMPTATVKTRLRRGRERLKKVLKEVYNYEG